MTRKGTLKSLEWPDMTVQVVGNNAVVRHLWVSESELDGKVANTKIGVMLLRHGDFLPGAVNPAWHVGDGEFERPRRRATAATGAGCRAQRPRGFRPWLALGRSRARLDAARNSHSSCTTPGRALPRAGSQSRSPTKSLPQRRHAPLKLRFARATPPLEQRGFELVVPPRPARGATTSECADALSAPSMSTGG